MPLHDVDLLDPDLFAFGPPHGLFADLRRAEPVHRHHRPGLPPFWVVTRHADVSAVAADPATFSSARNGALLDEQPDRGDGAHTLVDLDPPAHTALRAAVADAFTEDAVARRARRVRARCAAVLDRVSERGECDFVHDIARPVSLAALADLVGFPDEEDRELVGGLADVLGDPLERPHPTSVADATFALFRFAGDLAGWRRRAPADDLASALVTGPTPLDAGQWELFFLLLVNAGHLTTQHLLSGGALALLEHPEQLARLTADPAAVLATGVDELVRWVSPAMQLQRTATRDTELLGTPIAVGDRVVLYYVAANRDGAVFDEPETFDLGRSPNPHLGFGAGPHHCLGRHLARLVAGTLFEQVAHRLPDLTMAGPPEHLGSTFLNGLRSLPVRFTPTPRVLS